MSTNRLNGSRFVLALVVATIVGARVGSGPVAAAERQSKAKPAFGAYNADDATVDMFKGMKDGQLDVKFIPKDSTQANVLITNKSDKPLNVKLPEAFAAAPILAQAFGRGGAGGGLGGGGGNLGGGMGGGMNQGMGGGMGGMGGGMMGGGMMGGGGMGGGMFNIPPEKVGKFKVPCVCLEHGKPDPRAAVPYRIMPIEEFTQKEGVRELCTLLGYRKVTQRAAQVAAWNLNNDMTFEVLAAKRIEHIGGATEPYFSEAEVRDGMSIATQAVTLAADTAKDKPQSPGETTLSDGGFQGSDLTTAKGTVAADKPATRRRLRNR